MAGDVTCKIIIQEAQKVTSFYMTDNKHFSSRFKTFFLIFPDFNILIIFSLIFSYIYEKSALLGAKNRDIDLKSDSTASQNNRLVTCLRCVGSFNDDLNKIFC